MIYPENETAKRVVKKLAANIHYETIDLSITMKIVKLTVPSFLVGKSILFTLFLEQFEVEPIA